MPRNIRRQFGCIIIALAGLTISLTKSGGDPTPHKAPEPHLVDAMLSSIRRPDVGQFPTPESVVRFFLTQIQNQDLDEATRAIPITELYQNVNFLVATKYVGGFDVHGPLPDSSYHNAQYAFQSLACFDSVSLRLTLASGGDFPEYAEGMTDDQINDVAKKFDRSQLANMQVTSIKTHKPRVAANDQLTQALGQTDACSVDAIVQSGKASVKFTFALGQIAGNWRILRVQP